MFYLFAQLRLPFGTDVYHLVSEQGLWDKPMFRPVELEVVSGLFGSGGNGRALMRRDHDPVDPKQIPHQPRLRTNILG